MSNEQTVRNAIADIPVHWAADGSAKKYLLDQEDADMVVDALNLDPDMSVSELQRRLRIAERVLRAERNAGDDTPISLAWLTRDGES